MKQPRQSNMQKRSIDYYDYETVLPCETVYPSPECDPECPEYNEFDETCDEDALKRGTEQDVENRIVNGAKYTAGTTPWLVALDFDLNEQKTYVIQRELV